MKISSTNMDVRLVIILLNEHPRKLVSLDLHDLKINEDNHARIKVVCTNSDERLQFMTLVHFFKDDEEEKGTIL
jgi:maltooligosyltrehalose synthase